MAKNEKVKYQDLLEKNKSLVAVIENMARNTDHTNVIKLIPENSDQFYLDSDFIVDEETATYKAYPLNFSEAVLFKAGKEVARRENDITSSKLLKQIEDLKLEISNKSYLNSQQDNIIKNENEQILTLTRKCEDLSGKILELKSEIEGYKKKLSDVEASYSAEIDHLKNAPDLTKGQKIYTEYGMVEG